MTTFETDYHYKVDSLGSYLKTIESLNFNVAQSLHSPILYRGKAGSFTTTDSNCPAFGASAFQKKNTFETLKNGDYLSLHKKLDSYRYECGVIWMTLLVTIF